MTSVAEGITFLLEVNMVDRYRFEVIEGVGHLVPLLAPNRVAELVTDYIRTGR
jgi:hypothetical protein